MKKGKEGVTPVVPLWSEITHIIAIYISYEISFESDDYYKKSHFKLGLLLLPKLLK